MLPIFYWSDQPKQPATEREIEVVVKEVIPGVFAIAGVLTLLAALALEGYLYECIDMRPQRLRNPRYAMTCASFAASIASLLPENVRLR
jgi:hypothetical protein